MSSRRCAATRSGASCSPSPAAVPTSPRCARAPNATATTGSSTARRSGTPARIIAISASWSRAAIPTCRSTQGLTFFILDMKTPGIEIRPIQQISGSSHFNEVFFTDVRVPDSQRLGPVGDGWKVALTTLMNERHGMRDAPGPDFDDIVRACAHRSNWRTGRRSTMQQCRRSSPNSTSVAGLKYTKFRGMTALSRGETPGPESSIIKVVSANKLQDILSYGLDLIGMAGADRWRDRAGGSAGFEEALLYSPGLRIAGGTDEIMRNIIAERVLGLPGDIRPDKDVPFRELKSGKR